MTWTLGFISHQPPAPPGAFLQAKKDRPLAGPVVGPNRRSPPQGGGNGQVLAMLWISVMKFLASGVPQPVG